MRARKGRRSEAFWPSLVMKKWLNIKPKVNDFSEDEYTETESEDDACSLKDERVRGTENHAQSMEDHQSVSHSHISDAPPKVYHRRGKSETLRVQYINTKDVRMTIATWNVAGRLPREDLDIDDWLGTEEPADIYVIGFQEVVPLNAGNVLGAESTRPIPKWEAIIRRTLNKSLQPESKHKCYSAPPSPVLRTSSVADELADAVENFSLEIMNQEYAKAANSCDFETHGCGRAIVIGRNLHLKRIYGIDCDSRIDWPEHSLDASPQVISPDCKLRRVSSSSGRMGFGWKENPLVSSPHNLTLLGSGLSRLHHSSGNISSTWVEQQVRPEAPQWPDTLDALSDSSDGLSEEEDDTFLEEPTEYNTDEVIKEQRKSHPKYVRIVSKQMVGIYVSIWVRKRLRRHINNLKVSPVGVGLMGYMGNKALLVPFWYPSKASVLSIREMHQGSVSVSMSLFQTRLCFVCSHLTSGQEDGAEHRRNADVSEIIRRTCFSSILDKDQPQTIPSHDQIFWFGDLNYRLNMLDTEVRKLIALKQWDQLINSDQLTKELRTGHVFDGWNEGAINFPPTYKYEINSDQYVGEIPREGEKKRSPAWCDRILWLGKSIKQLRYKRSEMKLSDHRPVSSMFLVELEVLDHRKLQKALNVNSAAVHPVAFPAETEDL